MMDPGARAAHERGRDVHRQAAARREEQGRRIATARLILAGVAIALVGGIVWARLGPVGWATLALVLALFVALVVVHARIDRARDRSLAAARFHQRALSRLAHAWDKLPATSERFRVPDHPFAADLDVFGRASLMQLIDATETRFGEERLAAWLSAGSPDHWPEAIDARAEAARELAPRLAFREALATAAGVLADERPDPSAFLAWAEESGGMSGIHAWLGWAAPALVAAAIVLAPAFGWPDGVVTAVVVGVLLLGILVSAQLNATLSAVSARESSATRWRATLAAIEREEFAAPLLVRLKAALAGGETASGEMASLERIIAFADARRNDAFRFFIGPFLMWDLHCAAALFRWRARAGKKLRGWLEVLGEVEALASLGAFAFEHPGFAWSETVAAPSIVAADLGHPLIVDEQRVGNDVALTAQGRALVVTGSNMSGKSTLLRAIGANVVLANAGAPVCARSMRLGPLRVATSMRIEDSLAQGVSHFYAELRRLKRVVDMAREPGSGAVLFLLDEILHGTNSRERVLGASAVVRDLLDHGALGAVSTHDLGITALERDLGGRVENVHFEEQVDGTTMSFDYALRPGVVQSSNALRLMRAIGIVTDEAPPPATTPEPERRAPPTEG